MSFNSAADHPACPAVRPGLAKAIKRLVSQAMDTSGYPRSRPTHLAGRTAGGAGDPGRAQSVENGRPSPMSCDFTTDAGTARHRNASPASPDPKARGIPRVHRTRTIGSTDMPGPSGWVGPGR